MHERNKGIPKILKFWSCTGIQVYASPFLVLQLKQALLLRMRNKKHLHSSLINQSLIIIQQKNYFYLLFINQSLQYDALQKYVTSTRHWQILKLILLLSSEGNQQDIEHFPARNSLGLGSQLLVVFFKRIFFEWWSMVLSILARQTMLEMTTSTNILPCACAAVPRFLILYRYLFCWRLCCIPLSYHLVWFTLGTTSNRQYWKKQQPELQNMTLVAQSSGNCAKSGFQRGQNWPRLTPKRCVHLTAWLVWPCYSIAA